MNQNFIFRLKVIYYFSIFIAILTLSRLFYLQIIIHDKITNYGKKEFEKNISELIARGKIYDTNGELLADSIVTWDLVIMKNEFTNNLNASSKLSKIIGENNSFISKKLNSKSNYIKIKKNLEFETYQKINNLIKEEKLKGILLEAHQKRIYPSNIAREILGLANEEKGLTGIELLYDENIKGDYKRQQVIRDANGNIIYSETEKSGKIPDETYLTIDSKIQFFSEESIKKYVQDSNAEKGIIIVEEVKTGKIKAMASYPQNYINLLPVEWTYEPGSTFKAITFSAALEENSTNEKEVFYCENGEWKFNDKIKIHDHEPEKNLTVKEIFEKSSNIGAAKIALKIGIEKFYGYIKAFGFGSPVLGFKGESAGLVKDLKNYKNLDLAMTAFGHAISVTPLQIVNAYSAIANKGVLLKPYLVGKILSSKNEIKIENKTSVIRKAISEKTAERVKDLLISVVDNGTGENAQIIGYSIAGKTGTANKIDMKTGKYVSKKNVASFCGFFPANEPRYAILVIIDAPTKYHYGGEVAAPPFKEVAQKIINIENIKPDREIKYENVLKKNLNPVVSD
jgi:cell division protein FtsI (penicillin-binding protein 3)